MLQQAWIGTLLEKYCGVDSFSQPSLQYFTATYVWGDAERFHFFLKVRQDELQLIANPNIIRKIAFESCRVSLQLREESSRFTLL